MTPIVILKANFRCAFKNKSASSKEILRVFLFDSVFHLDGSSGIGTGVVSSSNSSGGFITSEKLVADHQTGFKLCQPVVASPIFRLDLVLF